MIEQALGWLLTDAGITTPFRPRRKQGESPTIVYSKVSGVDEHGMDGPTRLKNERWQLDIWADRYETARPLANSVINALNGKKGWIEGVDVRAIIQLDDSSTTERDNDGSDKRQHKVSLDFQVCYRG